MLFKFDYQITKTIRKIWLEKFEKKFLGTPMTLRFCFYNTSQIIEESIIMGATLIIPRTFLASNSRNF